FVRLNILQDLMLEDVDTHADLEDMDRFFDVVRNTVVRFVIDNTELDLEILLIRTNGHESLVPLVKLEEITIVKIGDHVAIHDQKALLQVIQLGQRANCPQGLILKAIRNVETIPLAMVDIRLNHLCHVTHRERDMRKTKMLQLAQDRVEDRLFTKW